MISTPFVLTFFLSSVSTDIKKQECISVGCVLSACTHCIFFNSHQMSALVGRGSLGSNIEQVYNDGNQMSLAGGWGVGRGVSCLGEEGHTLVPCLEGGGPGLGPGESGHMGTTPPAPLNRMTDMTAKH